MPDVDKVEHIREDTRELLKDLNPTDKQHLCHFLGVKDPLGYIERISSGRLLEVSRYLLSNFADSYNLADLALRLGEYYEIPLKNRADIIDALVLRDDLSGKLPWSDFALRFASLKEQPSTDPRFTSAYQDVHQHMDFNNDWTVDWFLRTYLGIEHYSDEEFGKFLEQVVHPTVRDTKAAEEYVGLINTGLAGTDFRLVVEGNISGYPLWLLRRGKKLGAQMTTLLPPAEASLPEEVQKLKSALIEDLESEIEIPSHAYLSDQEYLATRRLLISHPKVGSMVPEYVRKTRSLGECVRELCNQNQGLSSLTYDVIHDFNPILDALENLDFQYDATYEIVEELGTGGFGVVYRVRHRWLEVDFALKVHSPIGGDEEHYRKRFMQEARILYELDDPNIVRVYDVHEVSGRPCIRMELVEGNTLHRVLEQCSRLPAQKSKVLAEKVAQALSHAHSAGIVHRDLKPSNVMLRKPHIVKVLDFGLGAFVERELVSRITRTGEHVAAGAYTAPELIADPMMLDCRSDIYSLGALWYYSLVGTPPAGSDIRARLEKERPDLSPMYVNSVMKCLAGLDERFESADELLSAIAQLESP